MNNLNQNHKENRHTSVVNIALFIGIVLLPVWIELAIKLIK